MAVYDSSEAVKSSGTGRPLSQRRDLLRPRLSLAQALLHLAMIMVAFVSIAPFVWMVFASFKTFQELVRSTALLPQEWTLANYVEIIARVNFVSAFRNSTLQATIVTLATLFSSATLGYVFAKYRFWGKQQLFTLLLATLMIPFSVVMVPLYVTIADMGLVNQLGGIIVTGLWSTFGIFMMRQFMETIPSDFIDAARIDGASEWRIFLTIIVPMSTAPLAALAIFTFLSHWDDFLWPLIVLNSPDKQTLPLVLAGLRSLYYTRYEMFATGSMLTVVPVLLIYLFGSRYFIRGLAMTGLKG